MKSFPLKVAAIYLAIALLWINISDALLEKYFSSKLINQIQSIKGSAFVVFTAVVLFFVLAHYNTVIKQKQSDYLKLFSENPNPMWVYDVETHGFLLANNMAIEKYGYSLEQFKKMKIGDLAPDKEPSEEVLSFLKTAALKKQSDSGIWVHQSKNKETFYMHVYSHSTVFEDRQARIVVGIDVTEKMEMERDLEASEKKLNALINSSDDIIWLIDKTGNIITANGAFKTKIKQLIGFDLYEPFTINVHQLPASGFTRNWLSYYNRSLQGEHLRVEEEFSNRTTSQKEYFEIIVTPIVLDDGELLGVGCFARNISVRKENENMIKQQVTTLKEIAWMQSHELRKPLANIMGLADLLKKQPQETPPDNQLFVYMEESCNELDSIVKKVVQYSSTIDSTQPSN